MRTGTGREVGKTTGREAEPVRGPGEVRLVGDKCRSSWGSSENYAMREAEQRDWRELAAKRGTLEEVVRSGVEELNRQREAWELSEARLFAARVNGRNGGVGLDPVLRSHLGLK